MAIIIPRDVWHRIAGNHTLDECLCILFYTLYDWCIDKCYRFYKINNNNWIANIIIIIVEIVIDVYINCINLINAAYLLYTIMLNVIFRWPFSASHVQLPLSANEIVENINTDSLWCSSTWIRPRWLSTDSLFGSNQRNRVPFAWQDTMYESFSKCTTSSIDGTNLNSYESISAFWHRTKPIKW